MQFVREQQRARYREKYGGDVTFPPFSNGLWSGDVVQFDVTETKISGRVHRECREGVVVDQLERTDDRGSGRIREIVIVVPAITESSGKTITPERLFRRERTAVTVVRRHGGPGHEADDHAA